jgi:glycerate kinase
VETVGLEAIIKDADLVITGEGRIDSQSIHGKTPIGVAAVAKRYGKPVIGIAGSFMMLTLFMSMVSMRFSACSAR